MKKQFKRQWLLLMLVLWELVQLGRNMRAFFRNSSKRHLRYLKLDICNYLELTCDRSYKHGIVDITILA